MDLKYMIFVLLFLLPSCLHSGKEYVVLESKVGSVSERTITGNSCHGYSYWVPVTFDFHKFEVPVGSEQYCQCYGANCTQSHSKDGFRPAVDSFITVEAIYDYGGQYEYYQQRLNVMHVYDGKVKVKVSENRTYYEEMIRKES